MLQGHVALAALDVHVGEVVEEPRHVPVVAVFLEQLEGLLIPFRRLRKVVASEAVDLGQEDVGEATHVPALFVRPL